MSSRSGAAAASADRLDRLRHALARGHGSGGPVGESEIGFYETSKLTIGNDDADPAAELEIEIVGTGLGLTADDFVF